MSKGYYYVLLHHKPLSETGEYPCTMFPTTGSELLPPIHPGKTIIPIINHPKGVICRINIEDPDLTHFIRLNFPVYVCCKVTRNVTAGKVSRIIDEWDWDWDYLQRIVLIEKAK